MGYRLNLKCLAFGLFLQFAVLAQASTHAKTIEGIWKADFESKIRKIPQRMVLYIEKDQAGKIGARWDYSGVNARNSKSMGEIYFDKNKLSFKFMDAWFVGKFSADGTKITGQRSGHWMSSWTSGEDFVDGDEPITFKKIEKAPDYSDPQTPKKPYDFRETEIAFKNKKGDIQFTGFLDLPVGKGPFPVVAIANALFIEDSLVFAGAFTHQGIGVFRVITRDRPGAPQGMDTSRSDEDFADDALDGLKFLKSQEDVDGKHMGLMGHSEGARVATLAALRSHDVNFIVMLGPSGTTGAENVCGQIEVDGSLEGGNKEKTSQDLAIIRKIAAEIAKNKGKNEGALKATLQDSLNHEIEALSHDKLNSLGGRESLESYAAGYIGFFSSAWGRFYALDDAAKNIGKLKCPVLALGAEKDVLIKTKESLKAIEEALKAGRNSNSSVVELPGLNHNFQKCVTGEVNEYMLIDQSFSPVALDLITKFILKAWGK